METYGSYELTHVKRRIVGGQSKYTTRCAGREVRPPPAEKEGLEQ